QSSHYSGSYLTYGWNKVIVYPRLGYSHLHSALELVHKKYQHSRLRQPYQSYTTVSAGPYLVLHNLVHTSGTKAALGDSSVPQSLGAFSEMTPSTKIQRSPILPIPLRGLVTTLVEPPSSRSATALIFTFQDLT